VGQTSAGMTATKLLDYQGFAKQAVLLLNETEHSRSNPDNHQACSTSPSPQAAQIREGGLECPATGPVGLIDMPFGRLYAKPMEIQLTPAQEAFLRQAIESGRISHAEEAVRQALLLWETCERGRLDILAALDEAESDLQTGNFSDYGDEFLLQLGEELKLEARASLKSSSRG
jgi:Arc/MetJ-type ribon-helix-helix transcriptional regulator